MTMEKPLAHRPLDLFIRAGLIAFLVVYCYQIFMPFIPLMLWSVILAVALYPLHTWIARKMGGKPGRAATLMILAILLAVLVPTTLLAISFADSITGFVTQVREGKFQVPAPYDAIKGWPVIGGKLHALWLSAHHEDIGGLAAKFESKIQWITKQALGYAGSAVTAMLKFLISLAIAGIWMAYAAAGQASARAIARRMAGPENGDALVKLSVDTIRAVAQGVIGIACIQALLLGAGFILVGIPAAGILALVVLLLGIVQVPALLVSLPAIAYVFSTNDSTPVAAMFAVYAIVAGSVDNVLKPLMLGRGVDAPMPVILLGVLGGMATGGIIGLFLGSVMLALGYQLFMAWVYNGNGREETRGHRE